MHACDLLLLLLQPETPTDAACHTSSQRSPAALCSCCAAPVPPSLVYDLPLHLLLLRLRPHAPPAPARAAGG
jgi:hypothetical protein